MADTLSPGHVRKMESFVERHGFLSWLGMTVESCERGRVRLAIPRDGRFVNHPDRADHDREEAEDAKEDEDEDAEVGPIHGGIVASAIDTASGFVLRTTFEDPAAARLTTTDLDVSYLRPAMGDLLVEAEVVRAGQTIGVADVTVWSEMPDGGSETTNGEREEIAVGRATYRLFRDEQTTDEHATEIP